MQVFRDWRYMAPLLGLAVITVFAAVLARSSDDQASAVSAPTATVATDVTAAAPQATPSAAPSASPNAGDVLLDARRKLDLAALRDALEVYRSRFGSYPTTRSSYQTACLNPTDALCALNGVASKLSFTDGIRPYEYRSDGASYTLYSEVQATSAAGGCPAEVPADLSGHQVFCVSSQGGGQ